MWHFPYSQQDKRPCTSKYTALLKNSKITLYDVVLILGQHSRENLQSLLGPVYTMDHEVGPWNIAIFNGPTNCLESLQTLDN